MQWIFTHFKSMGLHESCYEALNHIGGKNLIVLAWLYSLKCCQNITMRTTFATVHSIQFQILDLDFAIQY